MLSYILIVLKMGTVSYELMVVCVLIHLLFSLFNFLLIRCTDPHLANQGVSNVFFPDSDQTTLSIGLSA